jgi:hypothetical protein
MVSGTTRFPPMEPEEQSFFWSVHSEFIPSGAFYDRAFSFYFSVFWKCRIVVGRRNTNIALIFVDIRK